MKKKITLEFSLLCVISIIFSIVLSMLIYFNLFQKQVFIELETYTDLVENFYEKLSIEELQGLLRKDNIRVTIIAKDGEVLFDNSVDASTLKNHLERPEVTKALGYGEGSAVRKSSTLGVNTYYFARMLDNGEVLRVSTESAEMIHLFSKSVPVIVVCSISMFMICIAIIQALSIRIVRPILRFTDHIEDIENVEQSVPYEELVPFAKTIRMQHEDIKKQLNRLERSERVRQEFTANVSHELKTPLTSILGYAELIEQGMAKEEDAKRFAGEIRRNSKRLFTLISDIIELSEMDEKGVQIPKERLNLFQIAKECVQSLELNAKQQSIRISIKGGDCFIKANKSMMEELVMNLCDNAIRYNKPKGSVEVSVWECDDFAHLKVMDTGIGIQKQHQERIFERFYRVDKSRSKETGGTGLGLAIVKHILVKHDARIHLQSEYMTGTTIHVEIPKNLD